MQWHFYPLSHSLQGAQDDVPLLFLTAVRQAERKLLSFTCKASKITEWGFESLSPRFKFKTLYSYPGTNQWLQIESKISGGLSDMAYSNCSGLIWKVMGSPILSKFAHNNAAVPTWVTLHPAGQFSRQKYFSPCLRVSLSLHNKSTQTNASYISGVSPHWSVLANQARDDG